MGQHLPTVCVVMRTYERPVMLARALASVQGQTFADWHLVVVNNGGNVATVDSVVRVAQQRTQPGNITVLHLPDRVGMEEASNQGLGATDSEFFVIHDDDDSWNPTYLEVAVSALKNNPAATAVLTGVYRVHETYKNQKMWPVHIEKFPLNEERLTYEGMIGGNTFPPIAALFRRAVVQKVGLYDPSLPVLGDWEFNLRAVREGPFVFIPQRLANYHTRTPESESAAGNSIIVGEDLHQKIRFQLQEKWSREPLIDGVNKGELSRRKQQENEEREAALRAMQHGRSGKDLVQSLMHAVTHPLQGALSAIRLIRRVVR